MANHFLGFPSSLLPFLEELSLNNNRDWFADNKPRYEELVLFPAFDFIVAMAPHLSKMSTRFEAIPRRSGGSLMRVYRDTRFAKDKTPYKTNVGIQFRHVLAKDVHAPAFYVNIEAHDVFIGVGSWRPDSAALFKIRTRVAENTPLWRRVERNRNFKQNLELAGDSLKRPPRGFDPEHPLLDTLRRKDFIAIRHFGERDIERDDFLDQVVSSFRSGMPLMRFLCAALELDI
jgi:uncharacterized protein (TIGR02453 family)